MNISIKTSNIDASSAVKSYVTEKIGHVLRLAPKSESLQAVVELERTTAHHQKGLIFRVEINVRGGGYFFRAEKESDDLYAAIDLAKDELGREIVSYKDKHVSLFKRGARVIKRLLRMN